MSTSYLAPTLQDQGYTGATGTTPYKPATTSQADTLQGLYNNSPAANAPQVVSTTATVININFDGTKNNGEFPAPGETSTNVFELTRLQREVSNPNNTIYLPGVGAQTVPAGTLDANGNPAPGSSPSNWDSIPFNAGDVANGIVKDAYTQLTERVGAILAENPNAEISLNLSGFSRGGAEAVAFANYVNERGIPGLYEAGQVPIDSMVLFDPVDQTSGQLNTAWPTNVKSAFVMVAENEGRAIMAAMPVGPDATVALVPGEHADVGGSFNPDGVSAVTLKMARDFQEDSGVAVAEIPDSLAPNWAQMNVHNSGLDNYGNTVWSFNENYRGYEGAGFGSPSVQDVIRNGVPYVPSAENPAAGDALDYQVPADPSQPDGVQLTVREVTDRNGNSTLTVMDANGHVVMTAAPGDVLVREPSTGQFTLTNGVDGQISTYTPDVPDASTNPNSFTNFLDSQGDALSSAQQDALATQIDSLGLGGEGDLSFYALPNGGALIANADGDIVGEIVHSSSGDLNLRATGIDADGNTVDVNQHITEQGQSLDQEQYTQAQWQMQSVAQSIGLFNSLMNLQQWDHLNDLGKLSALTSLYSSADTMGGNLPGDLGGLASFLGLMQGLDSGNDLMTLQSTLRLGELGLSAYSEYMSDMAMQMMSDMMASNTVDAATSAAFDAAAEQALESAAASSAASNAVPYVSIALALHNFEDNPAQAIGTLVGMWFGGPIGGAIGGFIGGMMGGMFGDDDPPPPPEGAVHFSWDAQGNIQHTIDFNQSGGGDVANSVAASVQAMLQSLVDAHNAENPSTADDIAINPYLLPKFGFSEKSAWMEVTSPDGLAMREGMSDADFATRLLEILQDNGALAPAWQVQTQQMHYQQALQEGQSQSDAEALMRMGAGGHAYVGNEAYSLQGNATESADFKSQTFGALVVHLNEDPLAQACTTALSEVLRDVENDNYAETTEWVGVGERVSLQAANDDCMRSAA